MEEVAKLVELLKGQYSSLTIGFNDHHAPNYVDAKAYHDEYGFYEGGEDDLIDWASDEEREKALRENSVWTIHWYPHTQTGFNCVGASTLGEAVRYALEEYSD